MKTVLKYILLLALVQSCATKKYVNKKQLTGDIKSITKTTYLETNGNKKLVETTKMQLTNNGRINYAEVYNAENTRIETIEKKLFFNKRSFPNKEAYYCKTRWKPKQRERISCYTRKQYKVNEYIAYYNPDGTLNKTEDNFTDFKTRLYNYNAKTNLLETIIVLNKAKDTINTVQLQCLKMDINGNCISLQKSFTNTNSKKIITRDITYF